MSAHALLLALTLMAADTPPAPPPAAGEPLPAGAPTEDYPLTAWCYGAMSEYLDIYERVKPDLKAIDKMFGSSVPNEPEPYASDMAAARDELKVLADAVEAAEKASPTPIAPQGADAVKLGRSIWIPAEAKTRRELARAWLSWALPDRCDSTARSLSTKSALLGQALKYNNPAPAETPPPTAEPPAAATPSTEAAAPPVTPPDTTPTPAPTANASPAPPVAQPEAAPTPSPMASAPPPPPATPPDAASTPSPTAGAYQLPDPNGPVPDAPAPSSTPQP